MRILLLIGYSKDIVSTLLSVAVKLFAAAIIVASLEASGIVYLLCSHVSVWTMFVLHTCLIQNF